MRRGQSGRPAVAKSFLVDLTDVDLSPREAVFAAVGRRRGRKPARNLARSRHPAESSRGGFPGSIALVNPHYAEIEGITAVKTIEDLPAPPICS